MGYYINPVKGTKEEWLREHGEPLRDPRWPPDAGKVIVCLVLNPGFSAAGIMYDEGEFKDFANVRDPRVKLWFQAPLDDVLAACPEVSDKL